MSNELSYEEKLLSYLSTSEQIIEVLSDYRWYLADKTNQDIFLEKVKLVLPKVIDSMQKEDLIAVMEKARYCIDDPVFIKKLFDKSIEFQYPLISTFTINFEELSYTEKVEYVKLLNSRNKDDFFDIGLKLREDLSSIYQDFFYANKYVLNNNKPIIPNEKLNKKILHLRPSLVLLNDLLPYEEKQKIFNEEINSDYPFSNYWHIFQLIREAPEVAMDKDFLTIILNNIATEKRDRFRKNNIIEFFNAVGSHQGFIDATLEVLKNNEPIKNGLCELLKEKVKTSRDKDITNFPTHHLFDYQYRNINLLQFLVIAYSSNKSNKGHLLLQLCKKDKKIFNIFTNSIHHRIHEFDYEVNLLDLSLQGKLHSSLVLDLYAYKTIDGSLKNKDKVAALLFKNFQSIPKSDTYSTLLNAISVLPYNLIEKYYKRYKDELSETKIHDLDITMNMLILEKTTQKKEVVRKTHKI